MKLVKQGLLFGGLAVAMLGLWLFGGCMREPRPAKVEEAAVPQVPAPPAAAPAPVSPPPGGWQRLPPSTTEPLSPAARGFFVAAKKAQADPLSQQWLQEALGEVKITRLWPALQPALQRAVDALQRWHESGEAVSIGARSEAMPDVMAISQVPRALAVSVRRSDEPLAAALLHFSHALRAPSNTAIAIAFGSSLAKRLAEKVIELQHQPVTEPFRAHALTEQDAMNLGRSFAVDALQLARMIDLDELKREQAQTAPGAAAGEGDPVASAAQVLAYRKEHALSITGDWLEEDFRAYQAFWDETEHVVATARTTDEMFVALEQRRSLSLVHPTSMLVRLVGEMVLTERAARMVTEQTEAARVYQARLAGAPTGSE
jgi:hypothetical protein